MVFHFTGAHKSETLAKRFQALIDASPTQFRCFSIILVDVRYYMIGLAILLLVVVGIGNGFNNFGSFFRVMESF